MFGLLDDEMLWHYTDGGRPESVEALTTRYARLATRESPDGSERWLNWIVRLNETHAPIGFVQATIAGDRDVADIAYVIGHPYWNRGFATEAATAMIRVLVARHGVARLRACVDRRNLASIALLHRLGLSRVDESDARDLIYEGCVAT